MMQHLKQVQYHRFSSLFIIVTSCTLLLVVLLNLVTDPYKIIGSPAISSFNKYKPEKADHSKLFKAVDLIHLKPKTILLGTSTTDFGLNPNHPALAKYQPVYNLGMPGSNMYELMRYFEQALYNQPDIKQVIIGVDTFLWDKYRPNAVDFDESRLETKTLSPRDLLNATVSMDALVSSIKTIAANLSHLHMEPYSVNGTRNENWFADNKPTIYRFIVSLTRNMREIITLSDERFNNFKKILDLCRERNIDVKVFVSPIHAVLTEGYYLKNKILVIQQEKRNLVKMIPVWDFSGFNSITTENLSNHMENYLDAFHFRQKIGDLMLNRLLSFHEKLVPNDFGFLMTQENIEAHFREIRQQRIKWQKQNPELVKLVKDLEYTKGL